MALVRDCQIQHMFGSCAVHGFATDEGPHVCGVCGADIEPAYWCAEHPTAQVILKAASPTPTAVPGRETER